MIRETIETLFKWGQEKREPHIADLHSEPGKAVKLITFGDGTHEIKEFNDDPVARNHRFYTLESFVDYMNSGRVKEDDPIVFVGSDKVYCELKYLVHGKNTLCLPLQYSSEYQALMELYNGLSVKPLWRLLVTDMFDCINPSLALQISKIKVSEATQASVEIDESGMESVSGGTAMNISFIESGNKNPRDTVIAVDWEFNGRIWECFDKQFSISLRLELHTKEGLKFQFHPRGLPKIMQDARLALVEHLRVQLPGKDVYEGTF